MKKIHHNSKLRLVLATILAIIALHTTIWPSLASAQPVIQESSIASYSNLSKGIEAKQKKWYWYSRYFLIQRYLNQFLPDINDFISEIQCELGQDDINIISAMLPNIHLIQCKLEQDGMIIFSNFTFEKVMREALKLANPLRDALDSPYLTCENNFDDLNSCNFRNIPSLFWITKGRKSIVISGNDYKNFLNKYIPTTGVIESVSIIEDPNVPNFDDDAIHVISQQESSSNSVLQGTNIELTSDQIIFQQRRKRNSDHPVSQNVINIELKSEGQFDLDNVQLNGVSANVQIARIRIVHSLVAKKTVRQDVQEEPQNTPSDCPCKEKGCYFIDNGTLYVPEWW